MTIRPMTAAMSVVSAATLRAMLLAMSAALTPIIAAAEPSNGPIFKDFGPTFPITDRDMALPADFHYKAVFDVAESPDRSGKSSQRNPYIESVARFINMHARNGVATSQMDLAVVMHGAATYNTLSHPAHRERFGSNNPNLAMIEQLEKAGVSFYLCGQSAGFYGIAKEELASPVKLSLSAMTALVLLQDQGYRLLP